MLLRTRTPVRSAQDLSNPIASLISVPFQLNYDQNYGPQENGDVVKLVIQPVVPISLNDNWNLISRTIVPLIDQNDVSTAGGQSGLGDITAAMFRLEGANLELRSGDGSLAVIFNRRR